MATDLTKVEIIERQTVKPSSPTPHPLRTLQLSVFDQMIPSHVYFPTILFYAANNNINGSGGGAASTDMAATRMKERDYCQHLIQSLAKTLNHFYPLAGRFSQGHDIIQCTDDGAEFVTARVKCSLSQIFERPDLEMLTGLVPAIGPPDADGVATRLPLLAVQANLFECGGMAIGLNFSHRAVDGTTSSALISCWAKTALDDGDDDQIPFMVPKFDAAIATLQSHLASATAPHAPTRVLVVSALIWKCAMEASSKSSNIPLGSRPSSFRMPMDLRRRFEPPVPQNLGGNVVAHLLVIATPSLLKGQEESDDETIDLKDLVAKLRKGLEQQKETYPTKLPFDSIKAWQWDQECQKLTGNADMYHLCPGSWCRFPFYEANFGWGKPAWVSIPSIGLKDLVILIDTRDGKGIEAMLSVSEEIMEHFESNPELLKYASVNPRMIPCHVYPPTLLFYAANNNVNGSGDMAAMRMKKRDYCQHLIQSLAKTLTHFYPLAGRWSKGHDMIQCTDDGAEFVTARVKCSLSQIFEHPDPEMLTGLVPAIGQPDGDGDGVSTRLPLLAVQANLFDCGGIAIGLKMSHRILAPSSVVGPKQHLMVVTIIRYTSWSQNLMLRLIFHHWIS
ncbi:unnamed protein product [Prunus brigantina]